MNSGQVAKCWWISNLDFKHFSLDFKFYSHQLLLVVNQMYLSSSLDEFIIMFNHVYRHVSGFKTAHNRHFSIL